MRNGFLSLLLMMITGASCGCVQMYPTRSGFLTDYSQLVKVDKKDRVRANTVDPAALAQIDSFFIEPVVWLADDLGQPASNAKIETKLQNSLETALVTELSEIRPIVDELGPRTARVRAAVTGIQEAKPFANLFMAVQIAGPLFNGGAVAEIEVINPQGEQIAAQSAAFYGYEWDFLGYFWRPSHANTALKRGAKQFAKELEAANLQPPALESLPTVEAARDLPDYGGESRKGH
jgi:hypothetical protein